ncbi:hypothetical protein PFISCL1PPCAC_4824 [Pristionchus fissidentatus]|uniref:BTB domain-containing protein n=1 Tax=Pristionchus fissidentatus TaxID=1538716 RepID=A0AAV5V5F9_9BILA|nr:hypothetical protein PFISCL1PPCAC_4824 [Pristionchus fissidentatus]
MNSSFENMTIKDQGKVDSSYSRDTHSAFDHSLFPEVKTLRVRSTHFLVSSSYLSLHSPFFRDFFRSGEPLELDVDPVTFGDLLDLIYPCSKNNESCEPAEFSDRLDLALQLKLRYAIKRMLNEDRGDRPGIARIFIEHNAFESYKKHFTYPEYSQRYHDEAMKTTTVKRDDSDYLLPIIVTTDFADARTVCVGGSTFLVSSSALSLHSDTLRAAFESSYPSSGEVKLDVSEESFIIFLNVSAGIFPKEFSSRLLDDLVKLGATYLYDYGMDKMKNRVVDLKSEPRTEVAIELLKHYNNQTKLDQESFDSVTSTLSDSEMRKVLAACSFIPGKIRSDVEEKFLKNPQPITVTMRMLTGKLFEVTAEMGSDTTIFLLKKLVQECEEYLWHQQRLISRTGLSLSNECTIGSYGIEEGATIYLLPKLG